MADELFNKDWHKMVKYRFFLHKAVNNHQEGSSSLVHIRSASLPGTIYRMTLGPNSVTFLSNVVDVRDH